MNTLRVHSLETLATHDGPGIRMIVFLQGCQFRCLYCHNPDTWNLAGGQEMTCDEVVAMALKQKNYFGVKGGVTVSGGEPLLQRQNLLELFKKLHQLKISTVLDTNGSILDVDTEALLKETDLVILDVKHINPAIHQKLTGADNATILKMVGYLETHKRPFWLRYVLVPGWTDQPVFLEQWAQRFSHLKFLQKVEILPYHRLGVYKYEKLGIKYPLKDLDPPSKTKINQAQEIFETYFTKVSVH